MLEPHVLIPCYNEGDNVRRVVDAVRAALPNAPIRLLDDASDGASRTVIDDVAATNDVIVERAAVRQGKAANLARAFRELADMHSPAIVIDCDVRISPGTLTTVRDALAHADLVTADPVPLDGKRSLVERATVFSGRLQRALRSHCAEKKPAFTVVGRLFGLSAVALSEIVRTEIPEHTEDAHFALVVITRGLRLRYLPGATLYYRAPGSMTDHLRQSNRFRDGCALLSDCWGSTIVDAYLRPSASEIGAAALSATLGDPVGALLYAGVTAAALLQRGNRTTSTIGAWETSETTKRLG